jgi:ribosome assembly protein RRB1
MGDDEDDDMQVDDGEEGDDANKRVWMPDVDGIEEGDELEYDPAAYTLFQTINAEWPCLSFDFMRDSLGEKRTGFPYAITAVVGTQASSNDKNRLTVMEISNLHKTKPTEEDSDEDDSDDEDEDEASKGKGKTPNLRTMSTPHPGGVNRVRSMAQQSNIVSSWSDSGKVHIWDLAPLTSASQESSSQPRAAGSFPKPPASVKACTPLFSFEGHKDEGFAMDWSPTEAGRLLTGDCAKGIHLWNPNNGGSWSVSQPYISHEESVEDLQWSPTEKEVFASCSADKTVRIWDTRRPQKAMLTLQAHDTDVNVISWNKLVSYLMISGSDDATFKIWDMRKFKKDSPVAHFKWHTKAITSCEFHPHDESSLVISGEDDQVTVWDMSVEEDFEAQVEKPAAASKEIPPQLMFVHQGQASVKEAHFHPQIPGLVMSTGLVRGEHNGCFNIFKPDI